MRGSIGTVCMHMSGNASAPLLRVRNLGIALRAGRNELPLVSDLNFDIAPGERVGIVGESGCGKTVTGLSILGLLPPHSMKVTGEAIYAGQNLITMPDAQLRGIRGRHIAMVFQEPMSALDCVFTIGAQITETLRTHFPISRHEAKERAIALIDSVGIPLPRRRFDDYPHQLSGGMRQRAMIAIAIACQPALLIADEPTTALDVTVQAQIIDLLLERSERDGTALMFITHDLGVVSEVCTRLLTMYAGQLVEDAPTDTVLTNPLHPYTSGLLNALPRLSERGQRLPSIPGRVPAPQAMPPGCRFAPRCTYAGEECAAPQSLHQVEQHAVRCARHADLTLRGVMAS